MRQWKAGTVKLKTTTSVGLDSAPKLVNSPVYCGIRIFSSSVVTFTSVGLFRSLHTGGVEGFEGVGSWIGH